MNTRNCPDCGTPMRYDTAAALYRCPACGKRVEEEYETLDEATARLAQTGFREPVAITHMGPVEGRARSLFEAGHDSLWRGDQADAVRQFERALEIQHDFADAHLWLAKLSNDPTVQRDHLSEILAHNPSHHEALRLMMVLSGRLTPEQASRVHIETVAPAQPVESAQAVPERLKCPVCGGHLTVDMDAGRSICRFCGHEEPLEDRAALDNAGDALTMALLERRAKPVRWQVGARVLTCGGCGATRTIPARELSAECPFCGSNHVIVRDALDSFTQPEGLLPFAVGEQEARDAISARLAGIGERVVNLFAGDNNRVVRAGYEPVYLPFWVFDVLLNVQITVRDQRQTGQQSRWTPYLPPVQQFSAQDGVVGLAVPGFTSPSPELALELGEFDLDTLRPFGPALLADTPAALYDVDFDAASLKAHEIASDRARRNAEQQYGGSEIEVTAMCLPVGTTFQLVLMPVWVASLTERDGDTRPALVNGLNGRAALGRARRSDR